MAKVSDVIVEDARWVVDHMSGVLAPLRGTTFLLTGACGFLCSFLLDVLAELNRTGEPVRVLAVDNFSSGVPDRVAHLRDRKDVVFVTHDVSKPYVPTEPVHWIFHGASIASPTFYRRFPLETIDVNVNGTRHLLELCRTTPHVRSMVFLSTSEIYGDPSPDAIPTPETYRGFVSCTGPRACYDESKRLGETLCATYHRLHQIPVKMVRPFNVYGPGQRLDDRRIFPDLLAAALARRPIVLHSDGRATRAFCYVRDAVSAMLSVLLSSANGEAFNVGNDEEEISMAEVARRVVKVAGPPEIPIQYRPSEDPHYLSDNPRRRCPDLTKLRRHFPSWSPQVKLEEGIARTLRSYATERA
jgi:dTDP-glucose 4,6-dehydratase/UDP-glucuronate decarboxylase